MVLADEVVDFFGERVVVVVSAVMKWYVWYVIDALQGPACSPSSLDTLL